MKEDLLGIVIDEIKTNYSKFQVIVTLSSLIVGIIVLVTVVNGVIKRKQVAQ